MTNFEPRIGHRHREQWAWLRQAALAIDDGRLSIGGQPMMFSAERMIMRRHAELLVAGVPDASVLDVGYGMGIFADEVSSQPIGSYTGIEINEPAHRRGIEEIGIAKRPCESRLILGAWQEVLPRLGSFDAVMYDPSSPEGEEDADFARFVSAVASHMTARARFSYFSLGSELSAFKLNVLTSAFNQISIETARLPTAPSGWQRSSLECRIVLAW